MANFVPPTDEEYRALFKGFMEEVGAEDALRIILIRRSDIPLMYDCAMQGSKEARAHLNAISYFTQWLSDLYSRNINPQCISCREDIKQDEQISMICLIRPAIESYTRAMVQPVCATCGKHQLEALLNEIRLSMSNLIPGLLVESIDFSKYLRKCN